MRTVKEIVRREISAEELAHFCASRKGRRFCLRHSVVKGGDFSGRSFPRAEFYNNVLPECRFVAANLGGAMLGELDAPAASFRSAMLVEADVVWSTLTEADFTGVAADRASFMDCDLSGADFHDASLVGANFIGCNLSGADFSGARLSLIQLTNCVLDDVQGLDLCRGYEDPILFSGRTW